MPAIRSALQVGDRTVPVSNLQKVLYPKAGFTKADVINYYVRIAPFVLPHLRMRPLTLKRYPDGVDHPFFYEKKCPSSRPKWLTTTAVWSDHNQADIHYCTLGDTAGLVWAANLADLELHTFMACAPHVKRPTMMVFDLDPGAPADIVLCCRIGPRVRALLARAGLDCFPKTSGSKGLQIYVPFNAPKLTYDQTKSFARGLAEFFERTYPAEVVSSMKKSIRHGKVLVDWSQNDEHKTTICAYSLRAKDQPTVSTPVTWPEVEQAAKSGRGDALVFTSEDVLRRVGERGDLFAPVLELKQKWPKTLPWD